MRSGFPTIMRQMLGSVSSALLNIQAAHFGDSAVAAVTIANKIYMLVRNIILGIGQGYQPGADLLTFLVSIPFQLIFFRKVLKGKVTT